MRYLIRFKYDGTKFHGFQRQNDLKNVQGTLESILSNYLDEKIVIKGAGRTDAGVHALDQCAHFDTNKELNNRILKRINEKIEPDLEITSFKKVQNNFHARHSVKEKTYIYRIVNGTLSDGQIGYYYQVKKMLDIKKMKETCKLFVGKHDFQNYVSGKRDDYTSIIYDVRLRVKNNIIEIKFRGIGFYRYMVRHLVGAIVDVGKNRIDISEVKYLLDNPQIDKKLSVAPACGLYLTKIVY